MWRENSISVPLLRKISYIFQLQISSGMKGKYYINKKSSVWMNFKKTLNMIFSLIQSNIYALLSLSVIKKYFSLSWLENYQKKHRSMMHLIVLLISMKIHVSLCENICRKYKILERGDTRKAKVIWWKHCSMIELKIVLTSLRN